MGSTKKTETQNTYGWQTPPETEDTRALRTSAANLKGRINPIIRGQYAGARRDLERQFINPMHSYTTQAMRDATLQAGRDELGQQEAMAIQGAEFAADNADFDRQLQITNMTNPRLTQTGGTTTQSGGFLGDLALGLIQGGSSVGAAALM